LALFLLRQPPSELPAFIRSRAMSWQLTLLLGKKNLTISASGNRVAQPPLVVRIMKINRILKPIANVIPKDSYKPIRVWPPPMVPSPRFGCRRSEHGCAKMPLME
jgi:hypothetical protein